MVAAPEKSLTSDDIKSMKTLYLVYPCYLCSDSPGYTRAARCIIHIRDHHGYVFPSRATGYRRPKNREYMYEPDFNKKWDEQQFACTSCWYHTNDMKLLATHMEAHDPGVVAPRYRSGTRAESDFVYNGTFFEKKAVQTIFQQITDITVMFKEILRMKN